MNSHINWGDLQNAINTVNSSRLYTVDLFNSANQSKLNTAIKTAMLPQYRISEMLSSLDMTHQSKLNAAFKTAMLPQYRISEMFSSLGMTHQSKLNAAFKTALLPQSRISEMFSSLGMTHQSKLNAAFKTAMLPYEDMVRVVKSPVFTELAKSSLHSKSDRALLECFSSKSEKSAFLNIATTVTQTETQDSIEFISEAEYPEIKSVLDEIIQDSIGKDIGEIRAYIDVLSAQKKDHLRNAVRYILDKLLLPIIIGLFLLQAGSENPDYLIIINQRPAKIQHIQLEKCRVASHHSNQLLHCQEVKERVLRVRDKNSKSSKVIGRLTKGFIVRTLYIKGKWSYIEYYRKDELIPYRGWVFSRHIR